MKRLLFLITLLLSNQVLATPNIVVSIQPIHSIVSNLTLGITKPQLLLDGKQSAHNFQLKPSQASSIENADLTISIHPLMEQGIAKSLDNIDKNKKFYIFNNDDLYKDNKLIDFPNLHIWTSVDLMRQFAKKLSTKLIALDPKNKNIYLKNLNKLNNRFEQLQKITEKKLSKYRNQKIAAYSYALEFFLKDNHLPIAVQITQYHEQQLSVFKLLKAKKAIQKSAAKCLITTTNVSNKKIPVVSEGLNVRVAKIDLLGARFTPGINQYFSLIQHITEQVEKCLK